MRIPLALFCLVLLPSTAAYADATGAPGSAERRAWCSQQLQICNVNSAKPGFLGGPANFCSEEGDGTKNCTSACDVRFGEKSDCLTRK